MPTSQSKHGAPVALARESKARYDALPTTSGTDNLTLPVPDNEEYRALLWGAIYELTLPENYDGDDTQAADKFREMLDNAAW